MDRRGFIAGAALATLAVAGCSSSKKEAGSGTASIAPRHIGGTCSRLLGQEPDQDH